DEFLNQGDEELRRGLRERATDEEWQPSDVSDQRDLLDALPAPADELAPLQSETELHAAVNEALNSGDAKAIVEALGNIARARGMSQIARDTGLAREGLYRALSADGNPEFSTVLKVLTAVGFKLTTTKSAA
ncbi:addiction module antidote protein, partial [Mesorhizobium sp. M5C.F.Ca.IN.020.29.1.1]|uniref:addiction module antidote protein n=1 Tax=Mesorhizobium sp. M5C.F.Ca.IN.020.29.1.1 TaxID=2496770 RepID=UPI001FE00FC6